MTYIAEYQALAQRYPILTMLWLFAGGYLAGWLPRFLAPNDPRPQCGECSAKALGWVAHGGPIGAGSAPAGGGTGWARGKKSEQ